ncbi:LysR family substrate-binding domain-containing protein [Protaetiibacter larvae]|uniref:LysR family transcriptional regulator n=1 Tax=Protaetiibacter larvae TaxID=2592654 RepID=A0A5C1Y9V2_9MICO|nr:LysR family substrate-binding domain-containing protein [Protaetiibacter larvae]QEO10681.1 LysR family transcriptional regulator [Protaetiibacter larvae]
MSAPFVVAFVPGVTPGKWVRIWEERMRRQPIEVRPLPQPEALAALRTGEVQMALVREVPADDELHVIPLYREQPVVVVAKEHPASALDTVDLRDLDGEPRQDGQDAAAVELVAAGVGVAIMPQSLARLHARRDVVARPLRDAPDTGIGLAWLRTNEDPRLETFIGIVRGRTVNSSR